MGFSIIDDLEKGLLDIAKCVFSLNEPLTLMAQTFICKLRNILFRGFFHISYLKLARQNLLQFIGSPVQMHEGYFYEDHPDPHTFHADSLFKSPKHLTVPFPITYKANKVGVSLFVQSIYLCHFCVPKGLQIKVKPCVQNSPFQKFSLLI